MSGDGSDAELMVRWYSARIAEPTTRADVYGYWVFVFGLLLVVFGLLLHLSSYPRPASFPGAAGVALVAVGVVLVGVSQVIRFPLDRTASLVSYAGSFVGLLAVVWFLSASPDWRTVGVATPVVTLYAFGLVLVVAGVAFVPVVAGSGGRPAVSDETAEGSGRERSPPSEDAPSLGRSARFELYRDGSGDYRWRLLDGNDRLVGDSGESYPSRSGALDGIERLRGAAPGAQIEPEDDADGEGGPLDTGGPPDEDP